MTELGVICLVGEAGSGKDTVGEIFCRRLGYTRDAFADDLRLAALEADPFIPLSGGAYLRLSEVISEMGWDRAKREIPEVRALLQRLGEGYRKLFGKDFWIDRVFARLKILTVITDCRYENEGQRAREHRGMIVRLYRTGAGLTGEAANHASEQLAWVENYPHLKLYNDGSLASLEDKVVSIVTRQVDTLP